MGLNQRIPADLHQALEELAKGERTIIAGGTDIMVRHARYSGIRPSLPGLPLFIGHLNELTYINADSRTIRIGAGTTLAQIASSPEVPASLKEVLSDFASPAIRNSGTIGGNICNASPAGDTLPFLYARDADVTLKSVSGERSIPIDQFITGPGSTTRQSNELLVSVSWREPEHRYHHLWRKIGQRKANALSKLSVYAEWSFDGREYMRIAVGGTAPTVVRSQEVEAAAVKAATEGQNPLLYADQVSDILRNRLSPISDQRSTARYREETAVRIVKRLLSEIHTTGSDTDAQIIA